MGERVFEDRPAARERVPLLIGLVGPSGSGKTFSALRLATGIQRVSGGDIHFIDTEARRALHYADQFKFRHVAFGAPFSPLDYLAAIEHCVSRGAGTIVIDSMSHEHEGPGGVLEWHEREVQRMSRGDERKAERVKLLGWQKPKAARRRLINTVLQMPCNVVFCFRAKEKLLVKPGQEPKPRGWMAIAGDEFIYEMTINALLLPGACGVPSWSSEDQGSREQIKRPGWAREMLGRDGPLDEQAGEALARWAAGEVKRSPSDLADLLARVTEPAALGPLKADVRSMWRALSKADRDTLTAAIADADERVRRASEEKPIDVDREAGELTPEEEERLAAEAGGQ